MSSTPGGSRRTPRHRKPEVEHATSHPGNFRRSPHTTTNPRERRSTVRKSLKFDEDIKRRSNGDLKPDEPQDNVFKFFGASPAKSEDGSGIAAAFWESPPPPPLALCEDANSFIATRRSLRLPTKFQFPIAQIGSSCPTEPKLDLSSNKGPSQASDYGTCSEASCKPFSQPLFSIGSKSSFNCPKPKRFQKSKNTHSISSQSVGYGSDLDEVLSNLSIDEDGKHDWEDIPEEPLGEHLNLKDFHLKNIKACLKWEENGIGLLMALDGYNILHRSSKTAIGKRYDLRKRPKPCLSNLLSIETFQDINIEKYFRAEGLRIHQVSPVISIKPYDIEFIQLLPATIWIPLSIEPLPGDEVHCLYSRFSVNDIESNYSQIPWKSVEAGKCSIVKDKVCFETFHFGLFVVVIRPKFPVCSQTKNIRARVGGKLQVDDLPSIEVNFPKEATEQDIIKAQVMVYLDTEESVSEFLSNRLNRMKNQENMMEVDELQNSLATPIIQLEPHGLQFPTEPVYITLPVPDYKEIMAKTGDKGRLLVYQSNTHCNQATVWEKLDVLYELSEVKIDGEVLTVIKFPVSHFSFFKGVWEAIGNLMQEAKIGVLFYFVSFAMKCQANMEEYDDLEKTTKKEEGEEDQKKTLGGGRRFGLEVSMFQADKSYEMPTYKYKVGQSNPKLVKPGRMYVRLKSNYFIPDVEAGEEEDMCKEESDFRGRDYEKQFICKFKPAVIIERGPFGKVLITRSASLRQKAQPIFEFNLQKYGNEAEIPTVDYKTEQWSKIALRELATNLFITDGDNWRLLAEEVGMTKQEIRDTNLKSDLDPLQKIIDHYRCRGGTPEEFTDLLYRCHRTIRLKGGFSQAHSSQTMSSNGSSGRGSLSSNNARILDPTSHDSDTSGKTSGTRTSQDSGLPPGRKRSHHTSSRGSGFRGSGSGKVKRRRISGLDMPGPSRSVASLAPLFKDDTTTDGDGDDEDDLDSDLGMPKTKLPPKTAPSVLSTTNLSNDNTKLTDHFFWQVSEWMNVTNWKAIGRTLGMAEKDLLNVEHAHNTFGYRECSHQMLLQWKSIFPQRCTMGTLYNALIKEGLKEAAKKMDGLEVHPPP